ncbi:DUF6113 family protein [Streptomyces sp. NBC_01006]|uniref:DUF6113 family protein n=1 Tax=Streptomyces sp. NBC_01006 TaxID=2903716 RepID=UPI00386DABD5|nr:DUF6113 family protein [Streptomyces sp. NBC_01006]
MTGTLTPGRIATLLGLFVVGLLTGAAGWLVVDLWFPAGLLLGLLALFGLFLGGRIAVGTGLGVGAGALGWFLAYVVLAMPRPEGDFLLGSSGIGMYVYLLGGTVLAVMCATLRGPFEGPVSAARSGK